LDLPYRSRTSNHRFAQQSVLTPQFLFLCWRPVLVGTFGWSWLPFVFIDKLASFIFFYDAPSKIYAYSFEESHSLPSKTTSKWELADQKPVFFYCVMENDFVLPDFLSWKGKTKIGAAFYRSANPPHLLPKKLTSLPCQKKHRFFFGAHLGFLDFRGKMGGYFFYRDPQ